MLSILATALATALVTAAITYWLAHHRGLTSGRRDGARWVVTERSRHRADRRRYAARLRGLRERLAQTWADDDVDCAVHLASDESLARGFAAGYSTAQVEGWCRGTRAVEPVGDSVGIKKWSN